MIASKTRRIALLTLLIFSLPLALRAEFEEDPNIVEERQENSSLRNSQNTQSSSENGKNTKSQQWESSQSSSWQKSNKNEKRKYFVEGEKRVDAGVFHVGFAAGGNFYTEPKFTLAGAPLGEYFKDFGFQAGVYFDFDYEDTRLGLRGWVGYKYLLNSVHAFAFDGMVRYLFRVSDNAKFGLGIGASAGLWFRSQTVDTNEEVLFLPAFVLGAGFDFNPFLTDLKLLINRIGADATLLGVELSFGVRL